MSYRILYDSRSGKYEARKAVWTRIPLIAGVVLFVSMMLFPQIRAAVRSLLIPGEDAVTTAAFCVMANDLRSGSGFYEAIVDFCRMVIHAG